MSLGQNGGQILENGCARKWFLSLADEPSSLDGGVPFWAFDSTLGPRANAIFSVSLAVGILVDTEP
ncbi:MAG: hypothetical protein CMH56_15215 [Myxococcales bacterium]|nr:hypothetical protein [Myxococcales bacterium]